MVDSTVAKADVVEPTDQIAEVGIAHCSCCGQEMHAVDWVERYRKAAERYLWLRAQDNHFRLVTQNRWETATELDSIIDRMMQVDRSQPNRRRV